MRIAVFHNLPSGGAKRALHGFVRHLTETGHRVDAFLPDTADEAYLPLARVAHRCVTFPVRRTVAGVIASTLRYVPSPSSILGDLARVQRRIADDIDKGEYDVVFVEQDRYVLSPFVLKFVQTPTVYYCQQPYRSNEGILRRLSQPRHDGLIRTLWSRHVVSKAMAAIDRQNAAAAHYILANSCFSREAILGAYGLNAFVCYLGVDVGLFKPTGVDRENLVLSVGALIANKGYDFLVKSFARIAERIRPPLVIVANSVDRPWRRYIEQLAAQLGVRLEIRTMVSEVELCLYYNKAKLFAYAPYLEPFGLAPLEAMACGAPVIAIKEGGIRESVLDGETGVLTQRDEGLFAEAVTELLYDEKKREGLAERGIEAIRRSWTQELATERLLWHFRRAVHS